MDIRNKREFWDHMQEKYGDLRYLGIVRNDTTSMHKLISNEGLVAVVHKLGQYTEQLLRLQGNAEPQDNQDIVDDMFRTMNGIHNVLVMYEHDYTRQGARSHVTKRDGMYVERKPAQLTPNCGVQIDREAKRYYVEPRKD